MKHFSTLNIQWATICVLLLFSVPLSAGSIKTLIFGGGSSHDFHRWFNLADKAILETVNAEVTYTEDLRNQALAIAGMDVLYLSNNKAFEDQETKDAIFAHAKNGKGLLLVHPALWYNWTDWPEYNRDLCGGGSRGHDKLGAFEVKVTQTHHPIMDGVPANFEITDELYYFEADSAATELSVLASAYSKERQKHYPIVFTVKHSTARIVGITLGHDGRAHSNAAYIAILKNALRWVAQAP